MRAKYVRNVCPCKVDESHNGDSGGSARPLRRGHHKGRLRHAVHHKPTRLLADHGLDMGAP